VGVAVGGTGVLVGVGAGVFVAVGAAWVAVGAGDGTVVAVAITVGGAVVAVAGGCVAAGEAALAAGGFVAVGEAALPALLADGVFVGVGAVWLACDEPPADVFVAVGVSEGSSGAKPGEFEPSPELRSSGAAGGGFSAPVDHGATPPLRSAAAVVSGAEPSPLKTPTATRPPEMINVPPATNANAIALGVMTGPPDPALLRVPWRPRPCREPKEVLQVGRPSVGGVKGWCLVECL